MTPEQINDMWKTVLSTGDPTAGNAHIRFARAIEAATREECAKLVEQDLYPTNHTAYLREYNDSIKVLAKKIRSGT